MSESIVIAIVTSGFAGLVIGYLAGCSDGRLEGFSAGVERVMSGPVVPPHPCYCCRVSGCLDGCRCHVDMTRPGDEAA